ncbi:MAG: hypothetical protein QF464_23590, partial [Myxococcota bacterium]|nr:hypothetical protein [Myxococcota bacterium]
MNAVFVNEDGESTINCSIPQVQEWHHDRTIGRLGLLLRGDEGDITSVAWGDCATEGEDRLCADPDRRSTEAIALGETLELRQEGPHSHRVNGGDAVASPLGGWMAALGPEASIEVAVQHFWQTYPSGFEVRDSGISIDLYPDWAPDWTFSFFEEDGTPEDPLVYKPLPGHDVPGEESCLGEDIPGISDMDFYTHFIEGNMTEDGASTGCEEDHLKRAQVVSHGAGRTHQLELAFYPSEEGLLDRGAKRASMLNHSVILRQDPTAALRVNFLGLMMVPVQDGEDYRAMEEALEEILHLNALRFRCRHDFGFWHFGKVQGHYGRERLDRWVDGVQYGH